MFASNRMIDVFRGLPILSSFIIMLPSLSMAASGIRTKVVAEESRRSRTVTSGCARFKVMFAVTERLSVRSARRGGVSR